MPEPVNEFQLTKRIVKEVEKRFPNVWRLKVHGDGYQRKGVPDLLFVVRGRMIAIEVKHRKPGESDERLLSRVSRAQWKELDDLKRAGALVEVCWSVESALALIADYEATHFDM